MLANTSEGKEGLDLIYCILRQTRMGLFCSRIKKQRVSSSRRQPTYSSWDGIVNQKEGQDIRPGLLVTRKRVHATRERQKLEDWSSRLHTMLDRKPGGRG
jgi:hypothetical protein